MRAFLRFLVRYARPHLPQYILGGFMLVITNWIVVRIPAIIGEALNTLEAQGSDALRDARHLAVELIVLGLVLIVVRTLSRVLFFNPGREIEYRLGLDLFAHLLSLQRPFFNRHKIGELASIASNDTQGVRLLIGFAGLQILNVAVAIPLHLFQMVSTDMVLTLWCLPPVVLGAIYMRWTVRRFFTMVREGMQFLARLSDRVLETYAGISTIRAHAAERAALERFDRRNQEYLQLQLRVARIRAYGMPILAFSGMIGTGIVLWVGGQRVIEGKMLVGDMATFTYLVMSLIAILTSLAWVLAAVSRGIVALDRIDNVLTTDAELPQVLDDVSIRRPPALSIRDLSFTYPGAGEPALNGLDIELEAGQTLGIFGKTGAGKSTFVNLLTRVYTPPPKAIYLDGHDICDLALDRVRSAMAVVPQTPFLFSTTLRDNIILPEETDHEHSFGAESRLKYVLEAASLQDDVGQLPHGLDTIVGERGVMLSGGQRQRAALARALYRARPLLVLDDVLSAVDQTTETRLVKAIRALQGDPETGRKPTTIIVSHRTSVLEHADMIVVLDRGRIVGRGTHRDLLAQGGMYADTHAHQGGDG